MHKHRQILSQIENREFDLRINGGGVVGVGVAQDTASSCDLSELLIKEADFASGTSYSAHFHFYGTQSQRALDFRALTDRVKGK